MGFQETSYCGTILNGSRYIAAAATSNQAIWLRRILEDIGEKQEEPTTIYCDNKSAIAITKNPVQHSRTKHIDIKYHSLREATTRGEIELKSLGQAAPDVTAFIRAKTAAYPIFEMIERNTVSKTSSKNGRKLSKVDGHIQFKNVMFSYPSRPDVLIFNKLCLDIPAGKIVALVGGSGSGKSTVISLIERFYEPLSGHILLDGTDIRELDLKWLRQQIGLVNQEPALFATTIRDNILYGKNDATTEEITRSQAIRGNQLY
ncbi:UNVERIFIED_CONTAM: ABC transporter B family member 2 [Sesamum radiatum]|uniref:ABC transporter B family member 2 n=1 Tax=Sesamum radiatum TaxID=300843 RepID=A0AAW2MCQ6_SESRA